MATEHRFCADISPHLDRQMTLLLVRLVSNPEITSHKLTRDGAPRQMDITLHMCPRCAAGLIGYAQHIPAHADTVALPGIEILTTELLIHGLPFEAGR